MDDLEDVLVIIPSYCPPPSLPKLCKDLLESGFRKILIVNDGSSSSYLSIFKTCALAGAIVIHHEFNQGKGAALRTGINYTLNNFKECKAIVFCDDDGQHLPSDVAKVSLKGSGEKLPFVIGSRDLSLMPWKSYLGNWVMVHLLRLRFGLKIPDTQSGLRYFDSSILKVLTDIQDQKFSFEIVSIINLHKLNIHISTCPIQTIYFDKNKNTRFRAISDSIDVLKSFLLPRKK